MRKKSIPHREYEEIVEEINNLEFIRDAGLVFDAILFYIPQPHLSEVDRDQLRQCMEIIARGGAN